MFSKEPYQHKFHNKHVEEIDQLLGSKEMQLVMYAMAAQL